MFVEHEPLFDFDHINKHHYIMAKEYHDRYWQRLVSTKPANHVKAELSAVALAWTRRQATYNVIWVKSPKVGQAIFDKCIPCKYSPRCMQNDPLDYLEDIHPDSLRAKTRELLRKVFTGLTYASEPMYPDTLYHVGYDLSWLALNFYAQRYLGFYVGLRLQAELELYETLSSSCSVFWLTNNKIILCERPSRVDIDKGHVINMVWDR